MEDGIAATLRAPIGMRTVSPAVIDWLLLPPRAHLFLSPDPIRTSFTSTLDIRQQQTNAPLAAHTTAILKDNLMLTHGIIDAGRCTLGTSYTRCPTSSWASLALPLTGYLTNPMRPFRDHRAGYDPTLSNFVACCETGRIWQLQKLEENKFSVFSLRYNNKGLSAIYSWILSSDGKVLACKQVHIQCPRCQPQHHSGTPRKCVCPDLPQLKTLFSRTRRAPGTPWNYFATLLATQLTESWARSSPLRVKRKVWPTHTALLSLTDGTHAPLAGLRFSLLHHLTTLTSSVPRGPVSLVQTEPSKAGGGLAPSPTALQQHCLKSQDISDDISASLAALAPFWTETEEDPLQCLLEPDDIDEDFARITADLVDWSIVDQNDPLLVNENWVFPTPDVSELEDDYVKMTANLGDWSLLDSGPDLIPQQHPAVEPVAEDISPGATPPDEPRQGPVCKRGRRKRALPSSLVCDYCSPPQRFSKSSNLKRHVSATHQQSKAHLCELCDCAFSQLSNLKRHHSSVHLKEKPYSCETCGKVYAAQASLVRHRSSKHGYTGALGSKVRPNRHTVELV